MARATGVAAGRLLSLPRDAGATGKAGLAATAPGLRVASYNIHKCVGTDGKFDPGRITAVIAELGADLVALQEVDRRFGRRTALLDVAALRQATGLVAVPASDLSDGLGWHGNALLVRPGTTWRLDRLELPGVEPRGAVIAELLAPGAAGPIRVVAAHFGLLRRCRARQVETILDALTQGADIPTLLLGDLNEWRRDRTRSSLHGLEPLFGPVGRGKPSFPSRRPLLALDRILGCPRARVRSVEVHDSPLARTASDHLPLKARVEFEIATDLAAAA
ncbi:endonuclease/exonuclease/phosphatase family protein [Roseicella aquatilis]|uniref:EEP domain-containing protein n=1 Tax=Roseicella aquatilis TaxID=2527868 RepID=A0A4R4D826_9PROT|nr:endonuclease/exonuclease/phosphatase family protein [Roseicella aquatilis]TCZ55985.1 EEP domain-containing protein [Roseicella aquatilis]